MWKEVIFKKQKSLQRCFTFAFGEAWVQSGVLTVSKPRKITRDNTEKRSYVNFIYLTIIKWI